MSENNPYISSVDIFTFSSDFLTAKAAIALQIKCNSQLHQYNNFIGNGQWVRQAALVRYFGLTCSIEDVGEVTYMLCSKLNLLAENDYILVTLAPLICIPLNNAFSSPPTQQYAVVSYIALTPQGEEYIKENMTHMEMLEGGIPNRYSDEKEDQQEDFSTYAISEI